MWLLLKKHVNDDIKINGKRIKLIKIQKTNFLVGKNNSGKSYFLRNMLKDVEKIYLNKEELVNEMDSILQGITQISYNKFINTENNETNEICNKYVEMQKKLKELDMKKKRTGSIMYTSRGNIEIYAFDSELVKKAEELLSILSINSTNQGLSKDLANHIDELDTKLFKHFIEEIRKMVNEVDDEKIVEFGFILNDVKKDYEIEKYYLPVNRSIRHPLKNPEETFFAENDRDIFSERIKKEYAFDESINIVTGLNFYKDYKRKLLGSKEDREKTAKFEKIISEYFFDNQPISIIPDEESNEVKININDRDDLLIYNVGDGITSLIVLMYSIFMNFDKDKIKTFFIEEPENNFHPGYQKLFISMISSYTEFKNCIFFITTHSNHIIDMRNKTKQSMLYLCQKDDRFINIKEKDKEYCEILDELGANPTSVLIANKAIWVEGKYDALYIRKLLNLKYFKSDTDQKKYIEDYDYCFIPYGGKNMVLIDFNTENEEEIKEFICKAEKINPNYCIILDDDNMETDNKEKKKKNYQKLLKRLGKDRVYKHDVREIENYFSEDIVKDFIKANVDSKYSNDDFIEKLDINYKDYKMESLGSYINKQIEKNIIKNDKRKTVQSITGRKEGFTKNGALYDKQKFYNTVCEFMEREYFSYEKNVTEDAKNLIDFVERFIAH